jgi:hypothetical protein
VNGQRFVHFLSTFVWCTFNLKKTGVFYFLLLFILVEFICT